MDDYEINRKLSELERKTEDLDYRLDQLKRDLEDELRAKANKSHSHTEGSDY